MKRFLHDYWPTLIVMVVILYATLFPDPVPVDDMTLLPGVDKLIHAIMFGGLTGSVSFDYSRSHGLRRPPHGVMIIAALGASIAGGIIELLQDAMGMGRGAEWADFGADILGAVVAYFIAPFAIAYVLKHK